MAVDIADPGMFVRDIFFEFTSNSTTDFDGPIKVLEENEKYTHLFKKIFTGANFHDKYVLQNRQTGSKFTVRLWSHKNRGLWICQEYIMEDEIKTIKEDIAAIKEGITEFKAEIGKHIEEAVKKGIADALREGIIADPKVVQKLDNHLQLISESQICDDRKTILTLSMLIRGNPTLDFHVTDHMIKKCEHGLKMKDVLLDGDLDNTENLLDWPSWKNLLSTGGHIIKSFSIEFSKKSSNAIWYPTDIVDQLLKMAMYNETSDLTSFVEFITLQIPQGSGVSMKSNTAIRDLQFRHMAGQTSSYGILKAGSTSDFKFHVDITVSDQSSKKDEIVSFKLTRV